MFYLALTFWLMVGLLAAYATFKLFEGLIRPRWIHLVLLPGTVVAETAHFLAALLSGAPVREAKLLNDEPVGEGPAPAEGKQGVPVLGPLLMALLPILAALVIIYLLYRNFDRSVVAAFASPGLIDRPLDQELAQRLSWRLGSWFAVAHGLLDLVQRAIEALPFRNLSDSWKSWLFVYVTACLAVRMVPLRGNLRSGMASVVLVGLLTGALGFIGSVDRAMHDAWPLLAYVIALLVLLLGIGLLFRGVVALVFVLADKPQPARGR